MTKYEYLSKAASASSTLTLTLRSSENSGRLLVDEFGIFLVELPPPEEVVNKAVEAEIKKEIAVEAAAIILDIGEKFEGAPFSAEDIVVLKQQEAVFQHIVQEEIRRELKVTGVIRNQGNTAIALENISMAEASLKSQDFDIVLGALNIMPAVSVPAALDQIAGTNNANSTRTMTNAGHAFGNAVSARLDQVRAGTTSIAERASDGMTSFHLSTGSDLTYGFAGPGNGRSGHDSSSHEASGSHGASGLSGGELTYGDTGKLSVWSRGIGVFSSNSGDGDHAGFDRTTAGGLAGADMLVTPNLRVGATFGYARTDVTGKEGAGNEMVDTYYAGMYTGLSLNDWFVDSNVGVALNNLQTRRDIAFENISRTAYGKTSGYNVSLETKTGYRYTVSSYTVEPSVSLRYDLSDSGNFTETGANSLNLTVQGKQRQSVRAGLGGRIIRTFDLGKGVALEPELRLRWEHDILDPGTTTRESIGGQTFTVSSAKAGRDAGVFGAGLSAVIDKDLRLYTHYDSEVRANQIDHIVTAGFRYSW